MTRHPSSLKRFAWFRIAKILLARWPIILGLAVALEWHSQLYGQDAQAAALTSQARFTRGPFVQNTSPTSTQIIWRTSEPGAGVLRFGETPDLGNEISAAQTSANHVVTLTNLNADTLYYYQAATDFGNASLESPVEWFRTLKESGSARFTVLGDSGAATSSQYALAEVIRNTAPDLVLHTGDVVYGGFDDESVGSRFFDVYQRHIKNTPYYLAVGNHDIDYGDDLEAVDFRDAFYLPVNDVDQTESYYSFDHGDVHFAALFNPWYYNYIPASGDDQFEWLARDLERTQKPWKVVFMHMPMINSGAHAFQDQNVNFVLDQQELVDVLLPLAVSHKVDLIIAGHDHNYQSFAPTNGVHHFITGGGGATLYGLQGWHPATSQFRSVHHCVRVEIEGETARIEALNTDGQPFSSFQIHRTLPNDISYASTLHRPHFEPSEADDLDGNRYGQRFDFAGQPIRSKSGAFSCLGELHVNNDAFRLYIGLKDIRLYPDDIILLFIEPPGQPGVSEVSGEMYLRAMASAESNGRLTLPKSIEFVDFQPSVMGVLGNEFADGIWFPLQDETNSSPQGMFRLADGEAVGLKDFQLRQFNRSPQFGPVIYESHADYVKVSLPLEGVNSDSADSFVRLAAVAVRPGNPAAGIAGQLDSGGIAVAREETSQRLALRPVRVRLAALPDNDRDFDSLPDDWERSFELSDASADGIHGPLGDPDQDGMTNRQEFRAGTNPVDPESNLRLTVTRISEDKIQIGWRAMPGVRYALEQSANLPGLFMGTMELPAADGESETGQSVRLPANVNAAQFYRIRLIP